jgi:dTDP-glucose 4,6-dehydratase
LITGGTGFVGKSILDMLQSENLLGDVTICARNRPSHLPESVVFANWNLLEPSNLQPNFDIIIHAATPAVVGQSTPEQIYNNIVATMFNLISFIECHEIPPRVLFASSGAVYGELQEGNLGIREFWGDSQSLPTNASPYGLGKREAERCLREAGTVGKCHPIIARLFTFSGQHLPLNQHFAIGNFVLQAITEKKITVRSDGLSTRSYLDSSDMASWLIDAALFASGDLPLHVGSDKAISISSLAEKVSLVAADIFRQPIPVEIVGMTSPIDGIETYVPQTTLTRLALGVSETIVLENSIYNMFAT